MKDVRLIRIDDRDDVAVALGDADAGDALILGGIAIEALEPIARGHKAALRDVRAGESILKYGYPIGTAASDVRKGAWIHCHNLRSAIKASGEYAYRARGREASSPGPAASFEAFERPSGEVGIRNEIWIINTVGCVNSTAERLARAANEAFSGPAIDGVRSFAHPYGCSQLGEDHENTRRILAGLAGHPNAAAVLVLGLGCENNSIESFRSLLPSVDPRRFAFLTAQEVPDEMEAGMEALRGLARYAEGFRRGNFPVSRLRIGLKCGGSDAFSGISANPLVGAVCDRLIAAGGSALMTEVPEMFGAENVLLDRAADEGVFRKCARMLRGFKDYYARHGQPVNENPSPGNKEGGISTLEEKSLGCVRKGGTSPVVDALEYGSRLAVPGLSLLAGPGNDIVSVTALAAAGAHLVLFTTGRGTPLGGPVPIIKISSNSELARRKAGWIDMDAGTIQSGASMDELSEDLWRLCLDAASGKRKTRNEENDHREIAIFKDGVTL